MQNWGFGLTVPLRVHDKIPSLEKGNNWSPYLQWCLETNCSHTSQSKLKDFLFHFFGVLLKGLGAGRDSFQFCIKTKFTHALYYILIASIIGVYHWTPVETVGDGGLWQVIWLGHVLFRNKNPKKPFFSIPRQAAISWLT